MIVMAKKKINIVIVDSGVDVSHKSFKGMEIKGFSILDGSIVEGFHDRYGHGTAIFNIIKETADFANIINIKIPNIEDSISEEQLIDVLRYINSNVECDIINLSLGINICSKYQMLKECCNTLTDKGIIIVAAFDNNGAISYPAAFANVIGVISGARCNKVSDFVYHDDEVINVAAKGSIQKVAWVDSKYILLGGNSFACAHVTVQIARFLADGIKTIDEIKEAIKSIAVSECCVKQFDCSTPTFDFCRAVIFPFNKEMHSLIRYSHLLDFEIVDIYDVKYSANVGANTSFLLNDNSIQNHKIKNINSIDWESFDALIIGHIDRLSNLIDNQALREKLISTAIIKGKKIVCFDDLKGLKYNDEEAIYFPKVVKENIPPYRNGMLYRISKPVVGVFGTSSQQGKFTLQLKLRELLMREGYDVGQIGTEPSSLLFGMDYCFPMGYNSTVYIKENDKIRYLNHIMNELCFKDKDIILVGSQSGTVPYDTGNISLYTSSQYFFLMGTQPDCIVLVVNPFDELSYIERTIAFVESCVRCKVIAFVVFPMGLSDDWSGIYGRKKAISFDVQAEIKKQLFSRFKVPAYILGNEKDMCELVNVIIDYFVSEN